MISLVAAMTNSRVIGAAGKMPWQLPAELAYFKKITIGKTILMGRQTLESIGQPLPHRRNLVISRSTHLNIPGCEIYNSLETALNSFNGQEELMVIGGGSIFEQTIDFATRMYLTFIDSDLTGDTFFPNWDSTHWQATHCYAHPIDEKNRFSFNCFQLERTR
ncbi:MAG: dihydrofolate reductase [Proteobacteria bacterium]|nr:dihydrofolate reductase [Pseudomonadota bacterium]